MRTYFNEARLLITNTPGKKRAKRNPHDEAAHEKSWTAAMPREREQHWQKLKNAHVWQKKT